MAPRTPYLTVAEAADLLRVNVETVYRMVKRGELRHVRAGSRILIPPAAIDELERARTDAAAAR